MSVRGIRKTFGSIQALRGVDLDLWPGECLGLVGDNAAGKSTLTKILAGTYIPDQGTISLDGEPIGTGQPGPLTVAIRDRFWALMDEPGPLIEAIQY